MKSGWTKGGMKIISGITREQSAVATFITPSLKECLRLWGKDILYLKASGSKQKIPIKSELKNLGISFSQISTNKCEIEYKNRYEDIVKHDDLSSDKVNLILEYLDNYDIKDCAVTNIKILIQDDYLKQMVEEHTGILLDKDVKFIAELSSSHCEGDIDTELWEETPYNRDVLARLGFKRTILNCIRLIDNGQVTRVTRRKRNYFINWRYKKNKPLKTNEHTSPVEIASALKSCFGEYGYVKHYKKDKMDRLVLASMK